MRSSTTKTILERAAAMFRKSGFTILKPTQTPTASEVEKQVEQRALAVKNTKIVGKLSDEDGKKLDEALDAHRKGYSKY